MKNKYIIVIAFIISVILSILFPIARCFEIVLVLCGLILIYVSVYALYLQAKRDRIQLKQLNITVLKYYMSRRKIFDYIPMILGIIAGLTFFYMIGFMLNAINETKLLFRY